MRRFDLTYANLLTLNNESLLDLAPLSGAALSFDTNTGQPTVISNAKAPIVNNARFNGTPGDETLTGTNSNDIMSGFDGNDIIFGLGGNDKLYGGATQTSSDSGNDTINGGGGDDVITTTNFRSDVTGGRGNDTITTFDGGDNVSGNDGDDVISTGDGLDRVNGNDGDDIIDAGAGSDFLFDGNGNDYIDGGAGFDTLHLNGDIDHIMGKKTFDEVVNVNEVFIDFDAAVSIVTEGNGFVNSNQGWVFAGGGGDIIYGAATTFSESELVVGGHGHDTFYMAYAQFELYLGGDGNDTFIGAALAGMTQVGSSVQLDFGSGDILILRDMDIADFDATDIVAA